MAAIFRCWNVLNSCRSQQMKRKTKHSHIATLHMALQRNRKRKAKKKVELKAPRNRVKGLQWNMSKIMAFQLQWAYPNHHTRKNKTQRIDCFQKTVKSPVARFQRRHASCSDREPMIHKKVYERQKKKGMKKTQPKSDLTKCLCNNLSHANNTAIGLHPISGSKCNIALDQWYFGIGRNKKKTFLFLLHSYRIPTEK